RLPVFEPNGDSRGFHAYFRYVSRQQQTLEALRESDARFRSLVTTTREWIWETDLEGRFVYSNPAVEKILGRPADGLIGVHGRALVHPDDVGQFSRLLKSRSSWKVGWADTGLRWRHRNGTHRYLRRPAGAKLTP